VPRWVEPRSVPYFRLVFLRDGGCPMEASLRRPDRRRVAQSPAPTDASATTWDSVDPRYAPGAGVRPADARHLRFRPVRGTHSHIRQLMSSPPRPRLLARAKEALTAPHFRLIAQRGACGKPRVIGENRRPRPEPAETGVAKMRVLLSTAGARRDVGPLDGVWTPCWTLCWTLCRAPWSQASADRG
jgi:hypothetical protein